MKKLTPVFAIPVLFAILLTTGILPYNAFAQDPPFTVLPGLFDQENQVDLGLDTIRGAETITVFAPVDTTDKFSNGVVLTAFKDWLYCQWQSSAQNEDAQDTWVAYSRSQDGISWTPPMVMAPSIDTGYCSSGGWWVNGDTLIGYINVWPSLSPRGGFTYFTASTDGLTWTSMQPVLMADGEPLNGIFEQDPHALPDGRIINAAHFQPGLIICPIYTDDTSGIRGWKKAEYENLAISGGLSREIEPSWYMRSDGALVMTFRDQNGTFLRLASVSTDNGESWTTPVLTDMPDSRAKQSAGNLPGGEAYLVGNPVDNKTRIPLAITLSADGSFFNTAYVLRRGGDFIQPLRYDGTAKRLGYHYPKTIVWQDFLCVSYATNKEDVEYTRVPLDSLVIDTLATGLPEAPVAVVPGAFSLEQNYPNPAGGITMIGFTLERPGNVSLILYDVNGKAVAILEKGWKQTGNHRAEINASDLDAGIYYYRLRVNGMMESRKMVVLE